MFELSKNWKMSASEYLQKAVEYDLSGRKLEALKLYEAGISALLATCKSKQNLLFSLWLWMRNSVDSVHSRKSADSANK